MGGIERYPRYPGPDATRRHCWVLATATERGPWPRLILEWRRTNSDDWQARVVHIPDPRNPRRRNVVRPSHAPATGGATGAVEGSAGRGSLSRHGYRTLVEGGVLMADGGGPTIRLDGGPGHGQVYYESDFRDRIKAAQRMHHTDTIGAGWTLGYAPGGLSPTGGKLWTWQEVNCHPADPSDPELAPYGAAFAAEFHRSPPRLNATPAGPDSFCAPRVGPSRPAHSAA